MSLTRRALLALAGGVPRLGGQGMASRGLKPTPRGKPSGIPFNSRFTDVAKAAGLQAPVIYGGVDRKDYILETMGCGCAFIDYDNDGWVDIFLLAGTRFENPPEAASNRLYQNNRDGTFTDVTEKAGLRRSGWPVGVCVGDYDNDGFDDLFITYWGENVLYRNNGDGTFTDVTAKAGVAANRTRWGAGCTWIDYDRDGKLDRSSRVTSISTSAAPRSPGKTRTANSKTSR